MTTVIVVILIVVLAFLIDIMISDWTLPWERDEDDC